MGKYAIDVGRQQEVNDKVEQHRDTTIIVASIKEMMKKLPPITPERSIYRVSNRLRNNNPAAYTPQAISIGPLHHGKEDLMAMEQLKHQFLQRYLHRINMGVEVAFEIAQRWESEARNYYAQPINMNSGDFVKMMLVDGCFLVEFMLINYSAIYQSDNQLGPSFCQAITVDSYCDLLMLENQLPFFVLQDLFNKLHVDISLVQVAYLFLHVGFVGGPRAPPPTASTTKLNHLVDLLSFYYALNNDSVTSGSDKPFKYNPTATELWVAGAKFQKAKEDEHIMKITFKYGVLEIPHVEISDVFETSMRNLMAYEYYHVENDKRYAIQYALFMDNLINTEKDVSLLVQAEIITNSIGGRHEEIAKLFNNLCNDIAIEFNCYYYHKISEDLREHCSGRWNKWKTILKRDYFNTPWAFISFFAATVLILFTVLQFVFTVLPASK